jgi:hypothetical protein
VTNQVIVMLKTYNTNAILAFFDVR